MTTIEVHISVGKQLRLIAISCLALITLNAQAQEGENASDLFEQIQSLQSRMNIHHAVIVFFNQWIGYFFQVSGKHDKISPICFQCFF